MSEPKTFILAHETARRGAIEAVKYAPEGWKVKIQPPSKSRDQEAKYHSQIRDIAHQIKLAGRFWDDESAKRLLVDSFAHAMREAGTPLEHDGSITMSIDGERVVQLGPQTRLFSKSEASQFVEYLAAYGAENDVVFGDGD